MKNVIIIGGGCSGLTAAIYLKRANFNVKVFCNYNNGNLTTTDLVENFPGFPNGISGFQLLNNMVQQCKYFGVEIIENQIIKVVSDSNYVVDDCETIYNYDILLIATGLKHRTLNFKKDKQYINIHNCATCDGAFYKDKTVAVVGGGNTALQDALYLSNICKKVYLIHRRNQFRAQKCIVDRVLQKQNISLILDSTICQVNNQNKQSNKFTNIIITNVNNNQIATNIQVDALFVAVGFQPNINLFQLANEIKCKNNKFSCCKNNIYFCGDINTKYHQAIIACGDGASTAMQIIQENQ